MCDDQQRGKAIEIKTKKVSLTIARETKRKAESAGNDLIAMVSLEGFTSPAIDYLTEQDIAFAKINEKEIRNTNLEHKEKER